MASPANAAVAPAVQTRWEKPNFVLCFELVISPENCAKSFDCKHECAENAGTDSVADPFEIS